LTRTSSTAFGGTYVCAISTATGYVGQSVSNNADLQHLAGKSVTFYAKVKNTTADSVRLAIYDGTDTTYSDFNAGEKGYELLQVTATIADHPSDVAFRVYYAKTTATAYVTDCYVQGPEKYEYLVSYLSLVNNIPNQILAMDSQDGNAELPNPLNYGVKIDTWEPFGTKLRFTQPVSSGVKLRLIGRKYITQPDSTTSSDIDAPQTQIVSALAAVRLYNRLKSTAPTNTAQYYAQCAEDWERESKKRIVKYGMRAIPITRSRGV
jgi:hypothetical protein